MTEPTSQRTVIHRRVEEARAGLNPYVICRMPSGWAVMGEAQFLRGYSLLLPDPVVPDLNALDERGRATFLRDMATLGDALLEVTGAARMNYEILGNLEPALHAHVFPRYAIEPDAFRTGPPFLYPRELRDASPFDRERDSGLMGQISAAIERRRPMDDPGATTPRSAVILGPGDGRSFPMGRIRALFKADGAETQSLYSISEWWLEPHTPGPGAHSHAEDDIFFVLEGTMSVLVGENWTHANKGSFVLIPGGTTHDFENRGSTRAGVLNISIPGGFEEAMPEIANWFAENPPGDTRA